MSSSADAAFWTSCGWARSPGQVYAALPELALGAPPLVDLPGAGEGGGVLCPCTADLLEPTVRAVCTRLQAAMDGRALDRADGGELVSVLAALALEAGQDGLRAAAVPGLGFVAIAMATVQGGRFVLSALPAPLGEEAAALRRRLQGLPEGQAGAALRAVGRSLGATLGAGRELAEEWGLPAGAALLPESLLDDGLLLALRREELLDEPPVVRLLAAVGRKVEWFRAAQVVEDPTRPPSDDPDELDLARRLRRWDVGRALVDRVVLLTPGTDGFIGPSGPLGAAAPRRLLVPRGRKVERGVVVAIRLDPLVRTGSGPGEQSGGQRVRLRVAAAWRSLAAESDDGLHAMAGGFALAVFTGPLEALEFAERASRTLSGPRLLEGGDLAPAQSIGVQTRVSVGVAAGPIWGGTDGVGCCIDGPAAARALTLAATPLQIDDELSDARRVGSTPDGGGGVRCDGEVWIAALSDARRQGRSAVRCAQQEHRAFEVLPIRGWWDSRGRRLVVLGLPASGERGPAELVAMDPVQVSALEERDRALRAQVLEDAARPDRRASQRPRGKGVDPLAAGALLGDLGIGGGLLHDEDDGDPATDLSDLLTDDEQGAERPAWDATGFSLPQYSQEFTHSPASLEAAAEEDEAAEDLAYSVEVDDDYGFEEHGAAGEGTEDGASAPSLSTSGANPWMHEEKLFLDPAEEVEPERPGLDLDAFDFALPDETAPGEDPDGTSIYGDLDRTWDEFRTEAAAAAASRRSERGGAATPPEPGEAQDEVVPEQPLPGDGLPGDRLPGDALPGDRLPGDRPPGDGLPSESRPRHTRHRRSAPPPRPVRTSVDPQELRTLFDGYVVVRDDDGGFIFGLRDGSQIRDAHSYETGADAEAAYRAFVQAKIAEGFVPQLELWSPLPSGREPANLDHDLLHRAFQAMLTS